MSNIHRAPAAPRRLIALFAALILASVAFLGQLPGTRAGFMPAAHAAGASVSVSPNPSGDGPTEVTLRGSGFQYVPNAPGGVYVFFGAVTDVSGGSWAPSKGGKSGETFVYAGTPGAQLLVAFKGGSSSEVADGQIMPDGTWSAKMRIPGPTFQSTSGNPHAGQVKKGKTIDCRVVQCGIITIGAHGMWNANNESFSPVYFPAASTGNTNTGNSGNAGNTNTGTAGNTDTNAGTTTGGTSGSADKAPEASPSPSDTVAELSGPDSDSQSPTDGSDDNNSSSDGAAADNDGSADNESSASPSEDSSGADSSAAGEGTSADTSASGTQSSSSSTGQTMVIALFVIGLIALIGAVIYTVIRRRKNAA